MPSAASGGYIKASGGYIKAIRPLTELFRLYGGGGLAAGTAMLCGTLRRSWHDHTLGPLRDGIGRSGARPQDHAQPSRIRTLPDQG